MNLSLIRKMTEYPLKTRHMRKPMPPSYMVSINQAPLTLNIHLGGKSATNR